jgi:hypothetical protein
MYWLVIYFYIQGSWIAGDFVRPDGWSSIGYSTEQQCIEKMYMANENLQKRVLIAPFSFILKLITLHRRH